MTTLAGLRAQVRAELGDTSATPLWPDERLNAWMRDALRLYGRALPRHASVDLALVAGQAAYALPADLLAVLWLESPPGTRLAEAEPAFQAGGGILALDPPPAAAATLRVRYAALYPEPAADADVLASPPGDDDLLVLAVAAAALRWLWTAEAKALRHVGRAGTLADAAADRASVYERALKAGLAERRRGLRIARLLPRGP